MSFLIVETYRGAELYDGVFVDLGDYGVEILQPALVALRTVQLIEPEPLLLEG